MASEKQFSELNFFYINEYETEDNLFFMFLFYKIKRDRQNYLSNFINRNKITKRIK